MAVNKVEVNGQVKLDLSTDTLTSADQLLRGIIAHTREGNAITGTLNPSGGSLPTGISAFDFGTFTKSSASNTTAFEVPHNLGVVPDFVFFYAPANVSQTYSMLGAMRGTIVNWRNNYNSFYFYHGNSSSTVTITNNSNATYGVGSFTATSFKVASHSTSYYWRAGTYKYIAIKFS